jgi:hypothetical protein
MCTVCDADEVIKANTHRRSTPYATLRWKDREEGLDVWSEDVVAAEFSPGNLRVRIAGAEAWSESIPTQDLAGSLSALGVDHSWDEVDPLVRAWIEGGDFQPVQEKLRSLAVVREAPKQIRVLKVSEWRKKQAEKSKKRMQNLLKLPVFNEKSWSIKYGNFVWHARSEDGLRISLRIYNARGTVKRTRITLHAPLSVEGPAESVGRVIQLLDMERQIQQRADDMEMYIRQQRGLPSRTE